MAARTFRRSWENLGTFHQRLRCSLADENCWRLPERAKTIVPARVRGLHRQCLRTMTRRRTFWHSGRLRTRALRCGTGACRLVYRQRTSILTLPRLRHARAARSPPAWFAAGAMLPAGVRRAPPAAPATSWTTWRSRLPLLPRFHYAPAWRNCPVASLPPAVKRLNHIFCLQLTTAARKSSPAHCAGGSSLNTFQHRPNSPHAARTRYI